MTEAFALDDGSWAHPLVLVEDTVGKHVTVRTYLQPAIREGIHFDVLAAQFFAYFIAFQDELLAIVAQGELLTDVTLLTLAQDIIDVGQGRSPCGEDRQALRACARTAC